jgi:hypothetical protein
VDRRVHVALVVHVPVRIESGNQGGCGEQPCIPITSIPRFMASQSILGTLWPRFYFLPLAWAFSLYQGILQILRPEPVRHLAVNYAVLGICLLFDETTWLLTLGNFKAKEGFSQFLSSTHKSNGPPSSIVLLLNIAVDLEVTGA